MRIEIPEFKRCCCCLPLRYGLLVWSYLLLIPLIYYTIVYLMMVKYLIHYQFVVHWIEIIMYASGFLLLVVNVGLTFLFIVSAHKKSVQLLKVYYKYALYVCIASFASEILWKLYYLIDFWGVSLSFNAQKYVILALSFEAIIFGVKLYVLWMVRSEILKLENNYNFQFSNIAAEAENADYEQYTLTIKLENDLDKRETSKSMEKKHGDEEMKSNVPTYTDNQEKGPK